MSDTDEVVFDAPAPKKKKQAKRAKPQREAKGTEPFPGLTRTACANACNIKGCAISGKPYCAHPTKGGLHSVDMNNAAALRRLQNARDQLNVRIDPDRFK